MTKKCCILLFFLATYAISAYGQASCTWPLSFSTGRNAFSVGNVTGQSEFLRNLRIDSYSGLNNSQRIGMSPKTTPWITNPSDTIYVQFVASPNTGYGFYLDSITLALGQSGGAEMRAAIICSTDSTFATDTTILYVTNPKLPGGSQAFLAIAPQKIIPDGKTLFMRIFPWYGNPNSTGKYICPQNVIISGFAFLPGDSVSASVRSLSGFQHYIGTPSSTQSYTISGYGLTDSLRITPPVGFEISTDGGSSWHNQNSPIALAQSSGQIPGQPITITTRMNALSGGVYNGVISHSSANAITNRVAINGTAIDPITVSTSLLSTFQQALGSPSTAQSYTVSGQGLIDNIVITPPVGFELSSDSGATWNNYSSPMVLVQSGGAIIGQPITIMVRLNALSMGTYSGNIIHSTTGALNKNVAVNGVTIAAEPTMQSTLSFGTVTGSSIIVNFSGGNGSKRVLAVRSGTDVSWIPMDGSAVSGVNSNYLMSNDQGSGNRIVYDGSDSTVTVSNLLSETTYYFAIFEYNAGTGNTQNYLNTSPGTGSQATLFFPDTLIVSKPSLSFSSIPVLGVSSTQSFELSGLNFSPANGNIIITAPNGYQVSLRSDVGFGSSASVSYNSGGLILTTLYARFLPTEARLYSDTIKLVGGGTIQHMNVSGTGMSGIVGGGYFVSTTGNDLDPGTIGQPFATMSHAILVANAGDTIYVRGGTYNVNSRIDISKSGDSLHYYHLWVYPGEQVNIDRSADSVSHTQGVRVSGNYWHIKGLNIYNAGDNGMYVSGSHNIIEWCSFYRNDDSGLQLDGGASMNNIINCDSYWNYDWQTNGGNADGFAPKLGVGTGNYFYGCRSWQNSDDGWDGFQATATTTIENCWAFSNGYRESGLVGAGNGNGFKMGGNYTAHNHIVKNSLSFNNKANGFDQNHNMGSMTLLHCTGYGNDGNNYSISENLTGGKTLTITNSVEFGNKRNIGPFAVLTTDSWLSPFVVDASDFTSLDTSGVRGPRKFDGSLPDITFMHLALGSDLINAGSNIGLPYFGSAPDLGCFESDYLTSVASEKNVRIAGFQLFQNYPNPFNPSTVIRFSVAKASTAKLRIINILGQQVATLFSGHAEPGRVYRMQFEASSLSSGIYFSVLESNGERQINKMVLMK
jgi:hypothetical protein